MSEDKMLESFSTWWNEYGRFYRAGGGQYEETFAYEAWKACAAIKDAEIAEITKRKDAYFLEMCEVIDKNEKLLEEIAARDLMIKELREYLLAIAQSAYMPPALVGMIKQLLDKSEHHNSRALENEVLATVVTGSAGPNTFAE